MEPQKDNNINPNPNNQPDISPTPEITNPNINPMTNLNLEPNIQPMPQDIQINPNGQINNNTSPNHIQTQPIQQPIQPAPSNGIPPIAKKKLPLIPIIAGAVGLILVVVVVLLVTIFSNPNSNPEAVSKALVKTISKGDYQRIVNLTNIPKDSYIDNSAFGKYLDYEQIKIDPAKPIKTINKTKTTKHATSKFVEIKHSDDKVLSLNTVKINNRWYVDLMSYFDEDLVIKSPAGSIVKLNGVEINKKYKESGKNNESGPNFDFDFDYDVDIYTFPAIVKGSYKLTASLEGNKEFKEDISSSEGEVVITIEPTDQTSKKISENIQTIFNKVIEAKSNDKKFDEISQYYSAGDGSGNDPRVIFNETQIRKKSFADYEKVISNFAINKFEINEFKSYGKNLIYIKGEYEISYKDVSLWNNNYESSMTNSRDTSKTVRFSALLDYNDGQVVFQKGENIIPLSGILY